MASSGEGGRGRRGGRGLARAGGGLAVAVALAAAVACGEGTAEGGGVAPDTAADGAGAFADTAADGAGMAEAVARDTTLARLARSLLPEVEAGAGLTFRRAPNVARSSRQQLEAYLEEEFRRQLPEGRARAIRDAYARFGLLPDTLDLHALLRSLYLEQVVGYYDPASDTLFVRRRVPPGQLEPVLVHEMVHALQDQHTDLDSLMEAGTAFNDRSAAARAALEGHAMFVMLEWLLRRRTGQETDLTVLPDVDRLLGESGVMRQLAAMPALGGAPRVVRETLVFPYLGGMAFVQHVWRQTEGRPPPLGDRLPASTEQVLHPARYLGPGRDAPTEVSFPGLAEGWRERHADGLGELETRILLEEFLADTARARGAAAGWDGDRYRLVEGPGGAELLVWVSVWDGPDDAAEFAAAARAAFDARYAEGADRRVAVRRLRQGGRHAVRVVDRPASYGAAPPEALLRFELAGGE